MTLYTRMKERAYNWDFKITEECPHPEGATNCGKKHTVSYEDKMIHNALISNLSDSEIGSDYMCGDNLTLAATMKYLLVREAGKMDWKNFAVENDEKIKQEITSLDKNIATTLKVKDNTKVLKELQES